MSFGPLWVSYTNMVNAYTHPKLSIHTNCLSTCLREGFGCLAQNKGHVWNVSDLMTPGKPSRDRGVLINIPVSASLMGQFYMVSQKLLARLKHHIPNIIHTPTWDSVNVAVWTVSESVVTLEALGFQQWIYEALAHWFSVDIRDTQQW